MMLLVRLLALAGLAVALPAAAHEVKHGKISVVHPWTMEADGSEAKDAVVYMTIRNSSTSTDRLVGARCSAASKAELAMPSGSAEGPLEVGAAGELLLSKDGPRLMLRGLTRPLGAYDMLPVTLVFEAAGEVEIEVMVEARE